MRLLVGLRRDPDLPDRVVVVHALPELQVGRLLVRIDEVLRREGPILALVGEGVVGPRLADYRDALFVELAVHDVRRLLPVPRPRAGESRLHRQALEPPLLIASDEGYVEPPLEHVVEGCDVLGDPERVVRRQRVAEQVNAQPLGLHADEEAEQAGLVGDLESLDLQMVLGVAEALEADLVAEPDVLADLIEHTLV